MAKAEDYTTELSALEDAEHKIVPDTVHDWASEHRNSAIGKYLEWNDAVAGREFRLHQIRGLIALYIKRDDGIRDTVSLTIDRTTGGGYRRLDDVIKTNDLRELMIRDMERELVRFLKKYEGISALCGGIPMFTAIQEWLASRRKKPPEPESLAAE